MINGLKKKKQYGKEHDHYICQGLWVKEFGRRERYIWSEDSKTVSWFKCKWLTDSVSMSLICSKCKINLWIYKYQIVFRSFLLLLTKIKLIKIIFVITQLRLDQPPWVIESVICLMFSSSRKCTSPLWNICVLVISTTYKVIRFDIAVPQKSFQCIRQNKTNNSVYSHSEPKWNVKVSVTCLVSFENRLEHAEYLNLIKFLLH